MRAFGTGPEQGINSINDSRDKIILILKDLVDSEVAFEFVNGGIAFFTDIQDVVVLIILHKNGPDSVVVTIAM